MDQGTGGGFTTLAKGPMELKITAKNLVQGHIYGFRYRVQNSVGYGPYSQITYLKAAQVPSKPNAPIVISATSADIGLTMTQS